MTGEVSGFTATDPVSPFGKLSAYEPSQGKGHFIPRWWIEEAGSFTYVVLRGRHDLLAAVVDVVAVELDAIGEAHVLGVVQVPAVRLGDDPLGAAAPPARIGLLHPALDWVALE